MERQFDNSAPTISLEHAPQAFSKQGQQFWVLQVAGWLGYALVVFFAVIRPQLGAGSFNFHGQLLNLLVEVMSGFLLSYLQWRLIQSVVHLSLKKTLFISFFSAAVFGVVFNVIKLSSFKVLVFDQPWDQGWNWLEFGGWFLFSLTTMFVWTSLFFVMLYNAKLQREHEMLLRAQNAAKDAQLQMLRYQLNPHFMFNTLNAISTLIYKHDNDTANEMLDKLCEFFRYSLDSNKGKSSTLKNELDLMDLYLSIEKVRFGRRLRVDIDIDTATQSMLIPSMVLQPLVENAIKYAVEPSKSVSTITIRSRVERDRVLLSVEDEGQENATICKGMGIGIQNTKARLEAMFAGDYAVEIGKNTPTGTKVLLDLPLHRAHDKHD